MWSRCTNPKDPYFDAYGGRGIGVCRRWERFEDFFTDMGKRPSSKHSLERKNNNLGYSKSNCRWATAKEQGNNRRTGRLLTLNGKTQTVANWAREVGMLSRTIRYRIDVMGWPAEKALTTPFQRKRKRKRHATQR